MRPCRSSAKKPECKDPVSSYGARKSREHAAMHEAKSGWEIDVRKKYGGEWANWENAIDTDNDCQKVGGGLQCIAVGTPCKGK